MTVTVRKPAEAEKSAASPSDIDQVVLDHLRLADGIARRYAGRGVEEDDLVQVARLALVKAAHRYQPAPGRCFAGFAAPTISGEIKRHFRDRAWAVRPPRRPQELNAQVGQAERDLELRLHHHPSTVEIAAALDVDVSQVRAARQAAACFQALSMDAAGRVGHCPDLVVNAFEALETAHWLGAGLKELGSREHDVLRLRFVECLTQAEIGAQIGVSQMQVSRILRGTLRKLRLCLESSTAA